MTMQPSDLSVTPQTADIVVQWLKYASAAVPYYWHRGIAGGHWTKEWHGSAAVLAVLPRYPRYYRGNGYKFYGITAILESKYTGLPSGWGPDLRYYHGYAYV